MNISNHERRNLVETWLAAKLAAPGKTPTHAVHELNAELLTTYDLTRLYQWRRGERSIPEPVQQQMLKDCLVFAVIEALGVRPTERQRQTLIELILPPERKK